MEKSKAYLMNNSTSSSETSESHSIEESQTIDNIERKNLTSPNHNLSNRLSTLRKRMKESSNKKNGESSRPPWRAVSFSTLPKPDKNALLRAKLLDASRRLRTTKVAVGIQTDVIPSKLLKEVSLGAQTDLILLKEVAILTDGSYAKRRSGSAEYVLTYSVSQMTEEVKMSTASTQTLLPRLPGDAFLEACMGQIRTDHILLKCCSSTEQRILHKPIRMQNSKFPNNEEIAGTIKTFLSDTLPPMRIKKPERVTNFMFKTSFAKTLNPTELSWNINYDTDFLDYLQKTSTKFQYYGQPSFQEDTNDIWNVVDSLISESIQLVNITDFATRYHNKEFPKPSKVANLKFPADYWLPIICTEETNLSKLKRSKGFQKIRV
ncbi:uncharacterized protein isoform X1 [Musca autumnalis]|uniref:uncharacterized protein isoform X1 n=1 Tax=Musca autumnalis TaxID=221902 RepID=UPI003CF1970B